MKVMLDPGHSGAMEPGAVGPTGLKEADVALAIARFAEDELMRLGHEVKLTRCGDIDNDGLSWRAELANAWGADLFISIHANAADSTMAHGFEGYTTPGDTASDLACTAILAEIGRAFPELAGRFDYADGDPDKEARFTVIMKADCPAVLIETAFISSPEEESLLGSAAFRQSYGKAIARGAHMFLTR